MLNDAAVDQSFVVIGLGLQHSPEVRQGDAGLPLVEVGLTEEVVELVIVAVQPVGRLQSLQRRLDIEAVESVFRILEELVEQISPTTPVEGRDAVPQSDEAFSLLQRQHLVVHLRLPELTPLLAGDQTPVFEDLAQRRQARLIDQDAALLLVERRQ